MAWRVLYISTCYDTHVNTNVHAACLSMVVRVHNVLEKGGRKGETEEVGHDWSTAKTIYTKVSFMAHAACPKSLHVTWNIQVMLTLQRACFGDTLGCMVHVLYFEKKLSYKLF